MTYRKHGVDLEGSESTHPFPAHAQRGRIGHALDVFDVALLFVDESAAAIGQGAFFVVGADKFGLGGHIDSYLEAYPDFHLVLDAEAQFKRDVDVCWVHLIALEVLDLAVVLVLKFLVGVGVEYAAVGEVVVRRHAGTDAHGVLRAFAQGEIVGEGEAHTLVEAARVPIVGGSELEVAEEVETQGESFVGLVGDELGKRGRRDHQCNKGEKYFFHIVCVCLIVL